MSIYTHNNAADQNPLVNGLQRGRQAAIDPNEELICNNCINAEIANMKNSVNQAAQEQETPLDVQDRLNRLSQNNISSKVQERIKRTERVSTGYERRGSLNKERLIRNNESGVFFVNDPNQVGNDYKKQRAMDRYNRTQLRSSVSMKNFSSKTGVDDYYRNCVDNYVTPQDQTIKSKKSLQDNYNKELDNQIRANQKLKSQQMNREDNQKRDEVMLNERKFQEEQANEATRQRQLKEDCLTANRSMISLKNQKNNRDKDTDTNLERKNAAVLQRKLEEEERSRKAQDEHKKKLLQKELEKQVRDKKRKEALEKADIKPSANVFGSCTCQGMGVCSQCKKSYPLSFLNPKRNYADLFKRKNQMKQGNK